MAVKIYGFSGVLCTFLLIFREKAPLWMLSNQLPAVVTCLQLWIGSCWYKMSLNSWEKNLYIRKRLRVVNFQSILPSSSLKVHRWGEKHENAPL